MDKMWVFHEGSKTLPEIDRFDTEEQEKAKIAKYSCCSCGAEIKITPGHIFDHYGWHPPEIDCGGFLVRQLEFEKEHKTLYICKVCYKTAHDQETQNKNLAFEERYGIPRP